MTCLGRKSSWITEVESNGYSWAFMRYFPCPLRKKKVTCRSTPRNAIPQKSVREGDLGDRWWPKVKTQGQCCLSGSCEYGFLPPDIGWHLQHPSDQSIAQVRKFKVRGIENKSLVCIFSIFFSLSLYFTFPRPSPWLSCQLVKILGLGIIICGLPSWGCRVNIHPWLSSFL